MKRALILLLALALALPASALGTEPEWASLPRLYTAHVCVSARVFSSWEGTTGVNQIGTIAKDRYVTVHALYPTFALVTYKSDNLTGYVKRVCLDYPKTVDSFTTPPYGVDFNHFISTVAAQDAPVTSAPGGGDTFITLHAGARLSLIGFVDGYGKLIYHREYGYIDARLLDEILPVYESPEDADAARPIAAYTSFYKITTDESNLNRMTNIAVACRKLGQVPLPPGGRLDFNADIGPYRASEGYMPAGVLVEGELQQGYGGGTCQVSSTLYNVVLQLPGLTVLQRRAHGDNGASYLPIGVDAAVGNSTLNFRFRNDYDFPIRIDGYSQDGALTIAIYRTE